MNPSHLPPPIATTAQDDRWLRNYYFVRAVVSATWVAAAFALGKGMAVVAAVLLVAYPAWDAVANFIDAARHGGVRRNRTQALNLVVSAATAVAVALALRVGMNAVLGVFGA